MAQETAGTIGIPVIKNEVLPALENYARRQERYGRLKAAQEAKAAEAAAKKAAEDAKFVPKFESSRGGLFSHVTEAKQKQRINQALDIYRDPNTAQQAKILTANEANRLNMDDADYEKQLETAIYKTAEDLQKNRLRKVGTDVVRSWASQQQDYTSPEDFAKQVRSNPDLIDFDAIGKRGKGYKQARYSIEAPGGGTTKQVEMSPLFEYKWEKDPFTGGEVPVVTGVNGIEAQKLIDSDPDIREAYDVFVKSKGATPEAARQFMENSFGKYGTIKYGQQFTMPKKGGAGRGGGDQFTMSIATPAGLGAHQFEVEALSGKGANIKGVQQSQTGEVGGKDDQTYSYEKEYVHPANKKVRLLQQYDKGTLGDYLEETVDGQYLLKSGFNYSNPTERTLYFADEDIYFGGTKDGPSYKNGVRQNWTRIKKGKEIPTATAENLIAQAKKAGKKSGVVKDVGYEITANMYTGEEGEDKKRPIVKMFIPKANAGEIKKHIEMEQQKKRRKPGPETTVDNFQGGEVDLGY
jgi:hypothetical protein